MADSVGEPLGPLGPLSAGDQLRKAVKLWGYSPEVVQVIAGNGTGMSSAVDQSVAVLLTAEHTTMIAVLLTQARLLGEALCTPEHGCPHLGTLVKRDPGPHCRHCNQLIYRPLPSRT